MLYWHPKIKDLDIPQPKTEILEMQVGMDEWFKWLDGKASIIPDYYDRIHETSLKIGYPLFLRTDQVSGKHDWIDTCYVQSERDLMRHVARVVEFGMNVDIVGLDTRALVFREFIEMDSLYTAFRGMPVSPERRYFISDGEVVCHHPYWIKGAIQTPSRPDWKKLSDKMNRESKSEVRLLTAYAQKVAQFVDGCWSVDFCRARDKTWYLIDMALASQSWHPKSCPNSPEVKLW
jgi:hypothetical protein